MKRKKEPPAGTQPDSDFLRAVYKRQFRETERLRRHVLSLLPLGHVRSIFEPGCGSGLLGGLLASISSAGYTGMDIDPEILPRGGGFIQGDAVTSPLPAEMYVTSFFFSSVPDPKNWLERVRRLLSPGGLFAVVAEYDYMGISEVPSMGLAADLRAALEEQGLFVDHGGRLDDHFKRSGYSKLHGGTVSGPPSKPDRGFLGMHLGELPEKLPLMTWPLVWGIWRATPDRRRPLA